MGGLGIRIGSGVVRRADFSRPRTKSEWMSGRLKSALPGESTRREHQLAPMIHRWFRVTPGYLRALKIRSETRIGVDPAHWFFGGTLWGVGKFGGGAAHVGWLQGGCCDGGAIVRVWGGGATGVVEVVEIVVSPAAGA